jgi:hypothetical protein
MDSGAAFWIFVSLIILLSMFAGGSSKTSTKSSGPSLDAPRRVVIETLDSKGQVIKRETATIAPDRAQGAQGAPKSRMSESDRRSDLAAFERMKTW